MTKKEVDFPIARIESCIFLIRGHKVMLDSDLAEMYGVETRVLKQAVRRNKKRFPDDFMFELTKEENHSLRSQNVILKRLTAKEKGERANRRDGEAGKRSNISQTET